MSGVHAKTAFGAQELTARTIKMPPRLRMMLIMVDGIADDDRLREEGRKIGAPEDALSQLRALGLIEPIGGDLRDMLPASSSPPPAPPRTAAPSPAAPARAPAPPPAPAPSPLGEAERFRTAKAFMTSNASSYMGLKSFLFILKLEKCSTIADLRELLPNFLDAVGKSASHDQLRAIDERLRVLLA